jgi:hypothetical protein
VVKISHPVIAIMALKTILAKLSLVLGDKVLVFYSMASAAGGRQKFVHPIRMAALAGNGCSGIILGMQRQAEAGLNIMVKGLTI